MLTVAELKKKPRNPKQKYEHHTQNEHSVKWASYVTNISNKYKRLKGKNKNKNDLHVTHNDKTLRNNFRLNHSYWFLRRIKHKDISRWLTSFWRIWRITERLAKSIELFALSTFCKYVRTRSCYHNAYTNKYFAQHEWTN